jgi:predicted MFS family arabinose efflux permease
MNTPAWQAIIPELVPRSELSAAVALSGVGVNVARAIGPALGGLIIAAAGSGAVFLLNAASFVGVMLVLCHWQRPPRQHSVPAEHVLGAMRAGIRYVRYAPVIRAVLVRSGIFILCGSALWALLPVMARYELGLDAIGYGGLLGAIGGGSVAGAMLLPRVQQRFSVDRLVVGATLVFAGATVALAYLHDVRWLGVAMIAGGAAWIALMSTFTPKAREAYNMSQSESLLHAPFSG